MSGKKIRFMIWILVLFAAILWTSYSMVDTGNTTETYAVSVIVNDSNHDRWISLRQGLEQAAEDYHIALNYVSTGKFDYVGEQLALIDRELNNGAKGVIVQVVGTNGVRELLAREPVILLESDIEPEDVFAYAGPDNRGMGKALAAAAVGAEEEKQIKEIGILCGNQQQLAMQQRLQGFQEGVEANGVEIVWMIDDTKMKNKGIAKQFASSQAPDAIVALGNGETEQMVDYLLSQGREESGCLLYGIGCSEKAVYYLDKGLIDTLVVPNEFNMGYQGMEAMANRLLYHTSEPARFITDYLVVDRGSLYDEENQKVLFPLVQ